MSVGFFNPGNGGPSNPGLWGSDADGPSPDPNESGGPPITIAVGDGGIKFGGSFSIGGVGVTVSGDTSGPGSNPNGDNQANANNNTPVNTASGTGVDGQTMLLYGGGFVLAAVLLTKALG